MPMISVVIVWMLFKSRPYPFTLICVLVHLSVLLLLLQKGDIRAFLSCNDYFIPSMLILIAVIGWVIYTMGGSEFSGWSALRYSTLSCLLERFHGRCCYCGAYAVWIYICPRMKHQSSKPAFIVYDYFPWRYCVVGWNIGVSILSPLNALLFINFVPVTTLVISLFQGNHVTMLEFFSWYCLYHGFTFF